MWYDYGLWATLVVTASFAFKHFEIGAGWHTIVNNFFWFGEEFSGLWCSLHHASGFAR